jgi:hypothetical protein
VNDEKKILRKPEHEALADSIDCANCCAKHRLERRVDGSKDERTQEQDSIEAPVNEVSPQRVEIHNQIRQFRHVARLLHAFVVDGKPAEASL